MHFLIQTSSRYPLPPDQAAQLLTATAAWAADLQAKGILEHAWRFAGAQGGVGILNVDSLDHLDATVETFPLAPFANIEVHALVDLVPALDRSASAIQGATASAV